jgi:serine phosphatase RsbU (regulator of sigma subunit)/anti-sigma regulatory factor (Ser/Thr protein kinase)
MSLDLYTKLPLRERSRRFFVLLTTQPTWASYFTSIVVVVLCTGLLLKLQHFVAEFDGVKKGPAVVALYFIAIALAAIMGGLRAGLFSVVLSLLFTAYFLIGPYGFTVEPSMANTVTMTIVAIVGSLVAVGMEAYRNNTRLLVANLDLLSIEQARANQESVLNRIGQAVRTAKHPEQVLGVAVESVGEILNLDRCYFITYNPAKESVVIEHSWREDRLIEPALTFDMSEIGLDAETIFNVGRTIVVNDAREDDRFRQNAGELEQLGVRSAIMVPLTDDGQVQLTFVAAMAKSAREWDDREVSLVEAVATQARSAVDAARIQRKEHNIAIQLQAALQPELSIDVPGLGIESFYHAALEEANVGGDIYDAFALAEGHTVFVLGDVSGKGLAAASQVAAIRHMLRCLLQTVPNVVDAIEHVNDVLIEQQLLPAFATLFVAVLNPVDLTLQYVSCGHEPGLIYRADKSAEVLHLPSTAPVIGVFENARLSSPARLFNASSVQLKPGDALLLFTDGVSDAGPDFDHLLGVDGVASYLMNYHREMGIENQVDEKEAARNLLQYCVNAAEKFAEGMLRDDICLLSVKIASDYKMDEHSVTDGQQDSAANNGSGATTDADKIRLSAIADVLRLATQGKLQIVQEQKDLPGKLAFQANAVMLDIGENVRGLRRAVRDASMSAGLNEDFADSLEMAAGEAANNSLVHAVNGIGSVSWNPSGNVQVRIDDNGRGIPYDDLPRATLERGYTTAGTLGQGFWIILQSVKRCWILTSDQGTTVVLEQDNSELITESLSVVGML